MDSLSKRPLPEPEAIPLPNNECHYATIKRRPKNGQTFWANFQAKLETKMCTDHCYLAANAAT